MKLWYSKHVMTGIPKDMDMRALRQKFDSSARRFLRDQRGSAITMFAVFLMVGAGLPLSSSTVGIFTQ